MDKHLVRPEDYGRIAVCGFDDLRPGYYSVHKDSVSCPACIRSDYWRQEGRWAIEQMDPPDCPEFWADAETDRDTFYDNPVEERKRIAAKFEKEALTLLEA